MFALSGDYPDNESYEHEIDYANHLFMQIYNKINTLSDFNNIFKIIVLIFVKIII